MSTPVSSTPPQEAVSRAKHKRTPTNELQEQMQHMISLQYQQQRHYASRGDGDQMPPLPPSSKPPLAGGTPAPTPASVATPRNSLAVAAESTGGALSKGQPKVASPETTTSASDPRQQALLQFPEVADEEVGQGTLLFPKHGNLLRPKARTASSDSPILLTRMDHYQPSSESSSEQIATRTTIATATAQSSLLTRSTQQLHLSSYGAVSDQQHDEEIMMGGGYSTGGGDTITAGTANTSSGSEGLPMASMQQQQEQVLSEEHEFHYGNPDYHDPYATQSKPSSSSSQRSVLGRVTSLVANCFRDTIQSEALYRSFCFGAIDGMLTGSGIVATFCGMHLLDPQGNANASFVLRTVVVVFAAAACFADSVCMALGHIWTTHVLASVHARERGQARQQLEYSKADAKGRLVDILLSKGMLKIDAMSLADTLEGYPDLFLAALTGESLLNAPVDSHHRQQHPAQHVDHQERSSAFSSNLHQAFPSYGRLREYDMDPDAVAVQTATQESRKESLFMMLGFSIFAIVPSLLFLWIPNLLHTSTSSKAVATTTAIHPNSLIVASTAAIMWCLGVWKSYFLDSNWLLFGIEAVVVLLLCIAAAYTVGLGLRLALLPQDVVLHVVSQEH